MTSITRRHFLSVTLGAATLIAALSAGCGSGGENDDKNDDNNGLPTPTQGGSAEGWAFLGAGGGVVLYPSRAAGEAAGLKAASGVRAEVLNGGPSSTTGSDGALRLTGMTPGLQVLRLTPSGGTPTSLPLTVVPDAVLPLGEHPIARQAAAAAFVAFAAAQGVTALFTGADVLVTSTPLPAGVVIQPALPSGDETPITLPRPSWIVYVDPLPQARFGHETALAIVDAETGKISGMTAQSWHKFNGANFYANSTINATSPDAVQTGTRSVHPHRAASVSQRTAQALLPPTGAACRAKDPDEARTHVLVVQGDAREDFGFDFDNIAPALNGSPFPPLATVRKVRSFEAPDPPQTFMLREFANVRDVAKSGDTFVFYLTTHGVIRNSYKLSDDESLTRGLTFTSPPNSTLPPPPTPATDEDVAASYQFALRSGENIISTSFFDGGMVNAYLFDPRALDFSPCKACRIILIIDTCYSGNWINLMRAHLESLDHKDVQIVTSADQRHLSFATREATEQKTITVEGGNFTVPLGGGFTETLIEGLARTRAGSDLETGADVIAAAFPFAQSATNAFNTAGSVPQQNPQTFRRPLEEDDVCGRGIEDVTIK